MDNRELLQQHYIARLLAVLYPPLCELCSAEISPGKFLCDGCSILPTLSSAHGDKCCACCGEPGIAADDETCLNCKVYPLPFRSLRSLWSYGGNVERLIKKLKYNERRNIARFISAGLAHSFSSLYAWRAQVVVALPSSLDVLSGRGFSHTALIAERFAKFIKVPFDRFSLCASEKRSPQTSVEMDSRFANVRGKFGIRGDLLKGKRVLIVDDVITTGASLAAASAALLRSGVLSVDALTAARSVNFSRHRRRLYEMNSM